MVSGISATRVLWSRLEMMRLLSTTEVADILRVTPSRVRQLVGGGSLPALRVGRDILIPERELKKYLRLPRRAPGRPKKGS